MPSVSILAEPPVAVVDTVVDRRGTRQIAEAYLQYLYSPAGQEIAAKHYFRPRNRAGAGAVYASSSRRCELFTVDEVFGGWNAAHDKHFADGGDVRSRSIGNGRRSARERRIELPPALDPARASA